MENKIPYRYSDSVTLELHFAVGLILADQNCKFIQVVKNEVFK